MTRFERDFFCGVCHLALPIRGVDTVEVCGVLHHRTCWEKKMKQLDVDYREMARQVLTPNEPPQGRVG